MSRSAAVTLLGGVVLAACQPAPGLDREVDPATLGPGLPTGFFWGAATAGMTVEGGLTDTFTEWEKGRSPDGRPHVRDDQRSTVATDSWNRFDEDLAVVEALGSNVYRFSLEWSRLEPRQGEWNADAMARYVSWCRKLRARGIRPLVTLQHFTLPLWVAERGGFENDEVLPSIEAFTRRAVAELAGEVDWYVTVNEPNVLAVQGYLDGVFPPGKVGDTVTQTRVIATMLKAHARMAAAIREVDQVDADGDGFSSRISIAHHARAFQPASHDVLDTVIAGLTDDYANEAIPRALKTGRIFMDVPGAITLDEQVPGLSDSVDYLGLNYYTRDMVRADLGSPSLSQLTYRPNRDVNDLGWDLYPDGLYSFLVRFSKWGWPIVITENGIPDDAGTARTRYLAQHVAAIERAVRDGADVRGYVHWALIDNFEPIEGFSARFGLYRVDVASGSLQRTPTESAEVFRAIGARIPK
jgi:beta-glucosidase